MAVTHPLVHLAGTILAVFSDKKENEMKSIQLLVSGLFLVGILLWARAAAQSIASTAISAKGRILVSGNR
jgi:hypothetical protein